MDQKPNGTLSGYYTYVNPGLIEYGTWEDIGNAVCYNVNDDNDVDDGLHKIYEQDESGSKYLVFIESFGFTVFKDNHDEGYGSLMGNYYRWNEGTGKYDIFFGLLLRTFIMLRANE